MALPIATSTTSEVDLVLACDPSLRRANPQRPDGTSPLAFYGETSDASHLVIPDDATVVTVHALDLAELRRIDEQAFRLPNRVVRYRQADELVSQRVQRRTAEIYEARMVMALWSALGLQAIGAMPRPLSQEAAAALAKLPEAEAKVAADYLLAYEDRWGDAANEAVAELDDDEYSAYQRHVDWRRERDLEICRRAIVRTEAPATEAVDGRFPVEVLHNTDLGPAIVRELAEHIRRVSRLGKAGPRLSAGSSGRTTGTSPPGDARAPENAAAISTLPTAPSSAAVCGG